MRIYVVMGYLWLKLNGWDSYGKVSYCFGGYAQKLTVFRGVLYLIITLPPIGFVPIYQADRHQSNLHCQ